MRHRFTLCLAALIVLSTANSAVTAPEDDQKKLQVKPPLPPFPSDMTVDPMPLPVQKLSTVETGPMPRQDDDKKALEIMPAPRPGDEKKAFEVLMVAPEEGTTPARSQVGVGFFNHSERDIVLEINERTVKLGSHYYLQIKMPREFVWREKDGTAQKTRIPVDADGVEIVFRK